MQVYLDNAATSKPLPCVVEAMGRALVEAYGNPSALHRMGFEAEKMVKEARQQLAQLASAQEGEVFFTSGGSEADNWAIFQTVRRHIGRGAHVITSQVEHPAVLESMKRLADEGADISYLPVDGKGMIDPDQVRAAIRKDTRLISLMQANNEVGGIMPIKEVAQIAKEHGIAMHSDCVQSFGKIDLPGVDMMSLSAHKIHGPKGVGALIVRDGFNLPPLIYGGGQEKKQRSGTENVPGIVGFGAACAEISRLGVQKESGKVKELRDYMADQLVSSLSDCRINTSMGDGEALPNILNISFLGTKSEVIIHMLEQASVYVSAGSACSAKSSDWSHVLRAMGLDRDQIEGAIRFSLSSLTTKEEVDYACQQVVKSVDKFRKLLGKRKR